MESAAKRIGALKEILARVYPDLTLPLTHRNPFELLTATILSAQCTDERVNQVTPELFRRFPGPRELAGATQDEIEALIRSTGFYHNKAKSLLGMARTLVRDFGGRVPRTMEELLTLPGVARKTANVVLGGAFGVSAGVVVDTHVRRLAGRLGLTKHEDPVKIEQDLMRLLPSAAWHGFSLRLIFHGRRVCHARKPACGVCELAGACPSAGKV